MKPIEVERRLKKEINGIETAIADISKQLAAIAEQKQQLAVPALVGGSADPVNEARQQIENERKLRDLVAQEGAFYAVMNRYQESLTKTRSELQQVQREASLEASRSLIAATNEELLAISNEIQAARQHLKDLVIKCAKIARRREVTAALKNLGINESYFEIWAGSVDSSTLDAPSFGKLSSLTLVTKGDRIKELPDFKRWVVVSQSLIKSEDLK